jgi:hypothetical protein
MYQTPLSSIIPQEFPDNSKVWVYQSSRAFIEKEQKEVNEQLYQFYAQWQSHGAPVKGWAQLVFGQFIVVLANEADNVLGGCSIDGMVRVIKSLERQYEVNFFDRMMLTFLVKNKPEMLPMSQVQYALDKGYINETTPLFNNTVTNKYELMHNWLIPLQNSWLAMRVTFPAISN